MADFLCLLRASTSPLTGAHWGPGITVGIDIIGSVLPAPVVPPMALVRPRHAPFAFVVQGLAHWVGRVRIEHGAQRNLDQPNVRPQALRCVAEKGRQGSRQPACVNGSVALQPGQNYLVFSEDTYVYIGPAGMLLSPDGKQWAPVQDPRCSRQLFGLNAGTFQVGLADRRTNKRRLPLL